jgi:hypothetical protein
MLSPTTNPTITSPTAIPVISLPASPTNDARSPFLIMNNNWLTGIIGSIGILVLLAILMKWSSSEGHKEVDRRIGEMLVASLSSKLGVTAGDVVSLLSGAGRSDLKQQLKEIVASVKVTATKTKIGHPVEMSVVLSYKDGTSHSARSSMLWDELPGNIRESLIRSESSTVDCPWTLPS